MSTALLRTTRPLTAPEARELTDRIRGTAEKLHSLLQEAYDRGAWSALGYTSWREYAAEELSISKSRAYRLLDHARVLAAIEEAAGLERGEISQSGKFPVAATSDLKAVLPAVVEEIRGRVEAGEEPEAAIAAVVEETRAAISTSGDEDDHTPDLVEELEHAHSEIRRLEALNEAFASLDDTAAELKKLSERYARLEGRLNQELTTSREAQRQAKHQGETLKKIREALGVRQTQEILPKIRQLAGGAR
jgi:hypothetical protein